MDQDPSETTAPPGKPALTIHVYSWATPIAAMIMLIIGLVAGFYAYPLFEDRVAGNPSVVIPTSVPDTAQQQAAPTDPAAAATAQASMMAYVVENTQHFIGDENAQVTIIEFSDFQ